MPDGDVPFLNPWWSSQYGIDSVEEFNTATDPFFDNLYALDPTGTLKAAAQLSARTFPGAPGGVGAAAYLTKKGYDGTTAQPFMQTLLDSIGSALQQDSGQEAPMPGLVIPDAFQVAINGVCSGQEVVNVVGVENPAGDAAGAAAAVRTAWKAASGPLTLMPPIYSLVSFRAMDLSSLTGDIAEVADVSPGTGGTSVLATMGACALVKWNGGTRSRSSRGRMYFGPLTETNVNADGRTLASAYVTALTTAMNAFRTSLNSSGYPLVVLSRTLSQSFPVTSLSVENVLATQRRRIRN